MAAPVIWLVFITAAYAAPVRETVIMPSVGETVRLHCSSSPSVLDFHWTFTAEQSSQAHRITERNRVLDEFVGQFSVETSSASTNSLVIRDITIENTGVYGCVGEGFTERTLFRVLVQPAASFREPVLTPSVNKTVRLQCSSAPSVLNLYWTFTELNSPQPHQVTRRKKVINGFVGQFSVDTSATNTDTLVIANIAIGNTGVYGCVRLENEGSTERTTLYRVLVQPAGHHDDASTTGGQPPELVSSHTTNRGETPGVEKENGIEIIVIVMVTVIVCVLITTTSVVYILVSRLRGDKIRQRKLLMESNKGDFNESPYQSHKTDSENQMLSTNSSSSSSVNDD